MGFRFAPGSFADIRNGRARGALITIFTNIFIMAKWCLALGLDRRLY